jgi:hypothetical protein
MRSIFFIAIFLSLSPSTLFGQEIKKCDDTILSGVHKKIGKLNRNEIAKFLMSLGKECENNAEFSEWSNELLFAVLDKQTDLMLKTIEKEERNIELDVILEDLESPISDMIVVRSLIPKVEKAKISKRVKQQILDRLKIAVGNSN